MKEDKIKDLYALIQESLSASEQRYLLDEEEWEDHLPTEETPLPKADSEVDILQPKLGSNNLEEFIIRKRLLRLARGTNWPLRKQAREILKNIYGLTLYP